MSVIFPVLAWLQIAWGAVKRLTLKAVDSLAESSGAYYTGFGWNMPLMPDEEPTEPPKDPQADYSASNAKAQATGDEYQRWLAQSDAFIESSPNYNPRMDKTC